MGTTTSGVLLIALWGLFALADASGIMSTCSQPDHDRTSIYDFSLMDIHNMKNISLNDYRGKQEPGENGTEILNGVRHVRPGNGFVPNFQLFEKIDVNGDKEHPLYTYLKAYCPPTADTFLQANRFYEPIKSNDVKWNWETFLVNHVGRVIKRAPPDFDPSFLEYDIEMAVKEARLDQASRR